MSAEANASPRAGVSAEAPPAPVATEQQGRGPRRVWLYGPRRSGRTTAARRLYPDAFHLTGSNLADARQQRSRVVVMDDHDWLDPCAVPFLPHTETCVWVRIGYPSMYGLQDADFELVSVADARARCAPERSAAAAT